MKFNSSVFAPPDKNNPWSPMQITPTKKQSHEVQAKLQRGIFIKTAIYLVFTILLTFFAAPILIEKIIDVPVVQDVRIIMIPAIFIGLIAAIIKYVKLAKAKEICAYAEKNGFFYSIETEAVYNKKLHSLFPEVRTHLGINKLETTVWGSYNTTNRTIPFVLSFGTYTHSPRSGKTEDKEVVLCAIPLNMPNDTSLFLTRTSAQVNDDSNKQDTVTDNHLFDRGYDVRVNNGNAFEFLRPTIQEDFVELAKYSHTARLGFVRNTAFLVMETYEVQKLLSKIEHEPQDKIGAEMLIALRLLTQVTKNIH